MKKVKLYEQFVNESKEPMMDQKSLIKFLKALPKDMIVKMPAAIRNGQAFQNGVYSRVEASEALKLVQNYSAKKSSYGELLAKVWNVELKDMGDRETLKMIMIKSFQYDTKAIEKQTDKISAVSLSFDYSNFDSDAYAASVRSSSLD